MLHADYVGRCAGLGSIYIAAAELNSPTAKLEHYSDPKLRRWLMGEPQGGRDSPYSLCGKPTSWGSRMARA